MLSVIAVAEYGVLYQLAVSPGCNRETLPWDQEAAGIIASASTKKEYLEMAQALGIAPHLGIGVEITSVPDTAPDCPMWLQRTMVVARTIINRGGRIFVVPSLL